MKSKNIQRGFAKNQMSIAKKEGIPMKQAGAILASASRKNAATSSNPNLRKVKG